MSVENRDTQSNSSDVLASEEALANVGNGSNNNNQPSGLQSAEISRTPQANSDSGHSRQRSGQFRHSRLDPGMAATVGMPHMQIWGQMSQMPQPPRAHDVMTPMRTDGTEVRTTRDSFVTNPQGQLQRVRHETRQFFAAPGDQTPISTQTTRTIILVNNVNDGVSDSNQATTTTTTTTTNTTGEGSSTGIQTPIDSPNLRQRINNNALPGHEISGQSTSSNTSTSQNVTSPHNLYSGQHINSNQQYYLVMSPTGPRALLLGPQGNQARHQPPQSLRPPMYLPPPMFPMIPLPQPNMPLNPLDVNTQVPIPQPGVVPDLPPLPNVPVAAPNALNAPLLAAWPPNPGPVPPMVPAEAAAANPNRELNANEIAARLNQAFEHLGLVMRLAVAVLVCTGGPDWTRNAIVWTLAVAIFCMYISWLCYARSSR